MAAIRSLTRAKRRSASKRASPTGARAKITSRRAYASSSSACRERSVRASTTDRSYQSDAGAGEIPAPAPPIGLLLVRLAAGGDGVEGIDDAVAVEPVASGRSLARGVEDGLRVGDRPVAVAVIALQPRLRAGVIIRGLLEDPLYLARGEREPAVALV